MYTIKYNFEDINCTTTVELLDAVKNIPENSSFSIVDKRETLHSVVFLDKKEGELFESYGQNDLFNISTFSCDS